LEEACRDVADVQITDESLAELDTEEDAVESTDLQVDDTDLSQLDVDNEEAKNTQSTYYKHYGRSKASIDKENNHILSTQKKCLNFVNKYRGHPKVCTWCKNHYKVPAVRWRWSNADKAWYRWYDGKWHYWGISKRGFTYNGWSWYQGYWHHGGYVYRYSRPYWYRFQNRHWVRYAKKIPVYPSKPKYKVCRPVYRLLKKGTPTSVTNKYVPRCKVGKNIYMYSDYEGCKFLGGKKVMQKRLVCKTGKQHKWARVTKCINYYKTNKGLNYKTGTLKRTSFNFK